MLKLSARLGSVALQLSLLGFVALVLIAVPFWGDEYVLRLVTRILIYALACASLDLILGYGGLVSFGHAAFFGLGVYTVGILSILGIGDALIAWPAAVAVAAAFGLMIGALVLRTRGLHLIMITLAFGQMLFFLFSSIKNIGGSDGMSIPARNSVAALSITNSTSFYWVVLATVAIGFGVLWLTVHSPFGITLRACKENERRAESLGIPAFRSQLIAFTISAGLAGLAGALNANLSLYMSPSSLSWQLSGEFIIMLVMGGMGTLFGGLFGSAAFLLLEELISSYTEHWKLVLAPILLAVVMFARRGLYGIVLRTRGRS